MNPTKQNISCALWVPFTILLAVGSPSAIAMCNTQNSLLSEVDIHTCKDGQSLGARKGVVVTALVHGEALVEKYSKPSGPIPSTIVIQWHQNPQFRSYYHFMNSSESCAEIEGKKRMLIEVTTLCCDGAIAGKPSHEACNSKIFLYPNLNKQVRWENSIVK